MIKIMLDPGHGGQDPGAEGFGLQEKAKALEYALELGRCLHLQGVELNYTRTTDIFVSLADRAILANNWGADYFISDHFNAFDSNAQGLEVYSLAGTGTGAEWAKAIVDSLAAETGNINRGAKTANYQVLRDTSMSAILIEGGFIDNKDDNALINSEDYKRKYMVGVTKAICKLLGLIFVNPYGEENIVDNAILAFGPDDAVTARRLAESLGNCAIFFRKDGAAPADVKVAKTLYIVGGGSVGHANEKILSGSGFFQTTEAVAKQLGQV